MADVIGVIKRAALEAVENASPTAVLFGTVTKVNPPEVLVEQRLTLSGDVLAMTAQASGSLSVGDSVVLLRAAGGQRYVVLDRVVS